MEYPCFQRKSGFAGGRLSVSVLSEPEDWKFKQIKPFDQSRAAILLYEAGTALGNQKYVDTAKRIGLKYSTSDVETIPYLVLKKK